ncbi:MAG: hypothetical protein IKY83_01815 [Proteobacteria bacterium]|nr:hypothetical protein [Pseudomonadota bacterium]
MKRLCIATLCLSCLCFCGCSKLLPRTPEEKLVDYLKEYSDIIIDNNGKCEKSADKINKFLDKNSEDIAETIKEIIKRADADEKTQDDAKKRLEKKIDEVNKSYSDDKRAILLMPECSGNREFKDAQQRFIRVLFKPILSSAFEAIGDAFKKGMNGE